MGQHTKIEWADHSWSPWRGCTKVSPGCANCYAETLSKRNPAVLGQWGKGKPRVLAKNWGDPVRWNERQKERSCGHCDFDESEGDLWAQCPRCAVRPRVFPSLCDWLDEEVPIAWLADFLALVNLTPHLDWLLLTKRPQKWLERIDAAALASTPFHQRWLVEWLKGKPPANVWFGVSVEDQQRANERIPALLQIPTKVRWLSAEPLLGPVDLNAAVKPSQACPRCTPPTDPLCPYCLGRGGVPVFHNGAIHWLVIGGESGHGARPCNLAWVRSLVMQCQEGSVPVFVKQMGSNPCCTVTKGGRLPDDLLAFSHPKCGDPLEWPIDLRVRQFPNPTQ